MIDEAYSFDFKNKPVQDWTNLELAKCMSHHVLSKGGPAKDDKGNPVMKNGAWVMMLEASNRLTQTKQDKMNEEAEIINLGQARESRSLRLLKGGSGPPKGNGPNWLAGLSVGQRFLCKDRTIGGSEHRDCIVTTDPSDVSCLLAFSIKGRDGVFEWHDPKLFSQQHTLIMTMETINVDDKQIQPGSVERNENAEVEHSVHDPEQS